MTSNPCFRSATGVSTCSLVGSSLEPAAGSTSPAASTRPRAVCICLFGLCGTLQGLVESRWHFGWPWGSIVAPWASILTHMGHSWEAFGHFGETLGLHFGTLGLQLGYPWGPCWCLVGTLGCGPGPLGPLLWKRLEKGNQNDRQNGDICNDFLSFCRKWQTAFGLRLRGRIRVLASMGALCFFNVFLMSFGVPPGAHFLESAAAAAPS